MTIGASLRSISNIQNKEFEKVKIEEIIFQAQFENLMAPFAPNHLTQTLPITVELKLPTAHKETRLIRIFHLHK